MDLFTVVDQVIELLRSRGRVSYRALRVQFHLDDEALDALKAELTEVHQIAVDQAGTMLVWTGDGGALLEPPHRPSPYHHRIAQVLDARFPEIVETQPELVAQHYTEAGLGVQAVPYWQRAGQHALRRSANPEAVQHLTQGIQLLATLPETPVRAQQELDLQVALGSALMATQGTAAPEVERTYTRARILCTQVGETPQPFPTLCHRPDTTAGRGAQPRRGAWGEVPCQDSEYAVVPGLSGAGCTVESGRAGPRSRARASL
jgi:hypothetical protein